MAVHPGTATPDNLPAAVHVIDHTAPACRRVFRRSRGFATIVLQKPARREAGASMARTACYCKHIANTSVTWECLIMILM